MFMVKSGDTARLGLLYERYKKSLFAYFYRSIGDKTSSEDLVQNVFYRILKYKDSFTGNGKFTSWMYFIGHNVIKDYYKKNNRYNYTDNIGQWKLHEGLNPDEQIIKEEQLQLLKNSMFKLSPEDREIIILSKYQGLAYAEIARILHCSEGAIKVRVYRALKELKAVFSKIDNK